MLFFLYKVFNRLVCTIPAPILRRMLRALHFNPDVPNRLGYQVYPLGFWNPFPDPAEVDVARLKLKRPVPGVNFNASESQRLLKELTAYAAEVKNFLDNRPGDVNRWNNTYPIADSGTLYAMLRSLKPKRYIEVGCGFSSQASSAALKRNADDGHPCKSTFIEPYPPAYLDQMNLPGEFIKRKIEQVPVERFQELEAGDVLFIDTSHVIKVQNDVEYEFIRVLPLLKPGVCVHIHDIFTPYDYPEEWLVGNGPNRGGNNEQYALECLLSGGRDWEVIFPVYLLWKEQREALNRVVDSNDRPAAFWIRKTVRS